ncbi:MAG: nuclear transport factor 2 family protein [Flavobacteriales bacterium]|nr:nuclear transport factor 2 family protein [Flavobacteriales bacterium]
MKTTFFFLFSLFLFSAQAQSVKQADADTIKAIMLRQQQAWNRGDMDGFMHGYWESDSLRFLGGSGVRLGYQPTLAGYKEKYPDKSAMGTLTFEFISTEYVGDDRNILMLGKWKLARENDSPGGAFVLLWKKIDGHWVIVLDHTS